MTEERNHPPHVLRALGRLPAGEQSAENTNARLCTCYPGEGPQPCPRKFALRECWRAAVLEETQQHIVRLKNQDRWPNEQYLLDFLMRVRTALEI